MDAETAKKGLASAEAARRRATFGPNQIEEKKEGLWRKARRLLFSPITFMLVAASALSYVAGRTFDGSFILFLLGINVGMTLWHEGKADHAIEALRAKLTVSAKALRDGSWKVLDSRELVPGDYVECSVGDLIPADLKIEEETNLQINQAVLTGESLPKEAHQGDTAYSGASVVSGVCRGEVAETGSRTYFGKIIGSVESASKRSSMERDILSIAKYLMLVSLSAVALLTATLWLEHKGALDILLLDLSLLIAGLPVSLPTVMTLIVSLGALALAGSAALVRRLSALEDLANVNLLLTDKTGTLTESSIEVDRVVAYAPYGKEGVLRLSAAGLPPDDRNLINRAIIEAAKEETPLPSLSRRSFTPADSVRKRTTAEIETGGKRYLVSTGIPFLIQTFCTLTEEEKERIAADVAEASGGARVLAVAIKENPSGEEDERDMRFAGLIVLSDPLRQDAPDVVAFLEREGVGVKMMTGDGHGTTEHIARLLGLKGKTVVHGQSDLRTLSPEALSDVGAFAEVFPDDKLALVRVAQKNWTVAVTGDGVNDLPAIKEADVGIAVANAVDALKASADLVLLSHGISIIKNALIEARKIFFRLYGYSTYRISESFRLILTVLVLGFLYADFPLTPIQLILIALLNDIPIITLAFDRVKEAERPAEIPLSRRFVLGSFFGLVGVANSLLLFFLLFVQLHLPWHVVQTAFFLKLTISGHMLIYVAHTHERWYRFLPAWSVILATTATQLAATALSYFGLFVSPIPLALILFVWLWSFFWMQVTEIAKVLGTEVSGKFHRAEAAARA